MRESQNAQQITRDTLFRAQSSLDWLVHHCSPLLVVSDPALAALIRYQPYPASQCTSRTVMDWRRLFIEVSNRQNYGGLNENSDRT